MVILGTSLSGIDTFMTLLDQDHRGPIHMVYPQGPAAACRDRLPQACGGPAPFHAAPDAPADTRQGAAVPLDRPFSPVPGRGGGTRQRADRLAHGETLHTPIVINTTGTATRLKDMQELLVEQLVGRGWLRPHPAGGAWADRATCRIDSGGDDAPRLYGMGQLINGVVRDTNAVWFNVGCCARAIDNILHRLAAEAG